jgi:2-dehydropantoate 2-reductase
MADWVLLATKAHQTPGAREWLQALCRPSTVVAVLQNGVEHEKRVAPHVNGARVLPVIVTGAVDRLGPGRCRARGNARLTVPDDDAGRRFRELAHDTGLDVCCDPDFVTAAWKKLCANSLGGALTVLTRQPMGVLHQPGMADLARELLAECARVARAEGASIEEGYEGRLVADLLQGSPSASPSILKDALAKRPLEYDARNAAVVRFGARHGIPTPLNTMASTLLGALSAQFEVP